MLSARCIIICAMHHACARPPSSPHLAEGNPEAGHRIQEEDILEVGILAQAEGILAVGSLLGNGNGQASRPDTARGRQTPRTWRWRVTAHPIYAGSSGPRRTSGGVQQCGIFPSE